MISARFRYEAFTMTELAKLWAADRATLRQELERRYDAFKAQGLKLDMTRGKPSSEQLDLSSKLTVAFLAPSRLISTW